MAMVNLNEIKKMSESQKTMAPPKRIIYTNPALVVLPYNQQLVDFVRGKVNESSISFTKNVANHYFMNSYMKSVPRLGDAEMLALTDGVSIGEITAMVNTEFGAYFNPAIISMVYDPDTWIDLLLSATHHADYTFLDVPHTEYVELYDKTGAAQAPQGKERYDMISDIVRGIVTRLNFLSVKRQHSELVH